MKRTLIQILIGILITIPVPAPAFAQTVEPTHSVNPTASASNKDEVTPTEAVHSKKLGKDEVLPTEKAAKQADNLSKLKEKADEMIQKRIEALNKTLTRINNDKNLSADDKTTLTTEINGVITGLNTLKTKIDADADLATLRNDTKQIVDSYHVFMILEPQVHLLLLIDDLYALDTKLTTLSAQAQTVLDNQKAAGKDTSAAQAALDDAKAQLQTIATKLATDKTTVTNVKLTDASGHVTLVTVRKDLASIRELFAKVRADFAKLRTGLKGENESSKVEPTGANSNEKHGLKIRSLTITPEPSTAVTPGTTVTPNTK